MNRLLHIPNWLASVLPHGRTGNGERTGRFSATAISVAAVYLAITIVQRKIIGACLVSLAGSVAMMVMHPAASMSLPDPDLFEYWIAAIAWCMLPFVGPHRMFTTGLHQVRNMNGNRSSRARSAAVCILLGFVITAICAPVIAPLPPLAQGDLRHTRFLPPLSTGRCMTELNGTELPNSPGFPEQTVHNANMFLMHRSIYFSGSSSADDPVSVEADDALPRGRSGKVESSRIVFLLGTDALGRDIFSRIVYGSRYSIGIGFIVVFISVLVGSSIGMAAGYKRGIVDSIFMRTIDVLMSIPTLFLVLALMAILGQSVVAMIIVLSATEWMGIGRIVRGEVLHLREREFISASRLLGSSSLDTLRIHVLPNVRPVIVNMAVLQLGNIFLAEASLSFLGLGIQAPNPSWGNMIADSMGHMNESIAGGIFPGIALSVLIVAVHLIGDTEN